MSDTAQAPLAPADPVAAAAALFRSEREPEAALGRMPDEGLDVAQRTPADPDDGIDDALADADNGNGPATEIDTEADDDDPAPEEGQPDAVAMPVSWPKEKSGLWGSLPAEAQAYLADRDAEVNRAFGLKSQEAANVRRAAEAQLTEAHANRDAYAEAIGAVLAMVEPVEPDPYEYGLGTEHYDRDAYDAATHDYRQAMTTLETLTQQQHAIVVQQAEEAEHHRQAAYHAIEEVARPRLFAEVPELATEKAPAILDAVVRYAMTQGIPPAAFAPENQDNITSAEILMAWKAMQYDRLQAAKGRVQPRAQPKPAAAPSIRSGAARGGAGEKHVQFQKDMARLARTGSVEDGAAIFRHMRQGK